MEEPKQDFIYKIKLFSDYLYFILNGIGKAYPVIFPFSSIMYGLINENTMAFFLAGLCILTIIINIVLKAFSKLLYIHLGSNVEGKCNPFWTRPYKLNDKGRIENYPDKCGFFSDCYQYFNTKQLPSGYDMKDCANVLGMGMPSGHSQISTAMTFLLIMVIWAKKGHLAFRIGATIFSIILALGVMWDRILLNCHTPLQVLIGSFIGYLLGIAYYYYLNWMYPEQLVQIDNWKKHLYMWSYPILLLIIIVFYLISY